MNMVDLSRFQFASTSIFHFFFVSLTVGLAFLIAVMETIAYVRKDRRQEFDTMSNFFGHRFLINFAVGVVTGIVQEFQFGKNWSEYSRFVGNIFGVPLALEVLTVTARAGVHVVPEAQIAAAPVPNYAGQGFRGSDEAGRS